MDESTEVKTEAVNEVVATIDHDEKGKIVSALKRAQKEAKTYREQLEALKGQLTESTSKYESLNKEVTASKHRAAFEKVALASNVRPEALEDAWTLSKYSPEGEVDEEALSALVGELVASRGYLVASAEASEAVKPAKLPAPGPGTAKGITNEGLDGKFVVNRAQFLDADWLIANEKTMAKAKREGKLFVK